MYFVFYNLVFLKIRILFDFPSSGIHFLYHSWSGSDLENIRRKRDNPLFCKNEMARNDLIIIDILNHIYEYFFWFLMCVSLSLFKLFVFLSHQIENSLGLAQRTMPIPQIKLVWCI